MKNQSNTLYITIENGINRKISLQVRTYMHMYVGTVVTCVDMIDATDHSHC